MIYNEIHSPNLTTSPLRILRTSPTMVPGSTASELHQFPSLTSSPTVTLISHILAGTPRLVAPGLDTPGIPLEYGPCVVPRTNLSPQQALRTNPRQNSERPRD